MEWPHEESNPTCAPRREMFQDSTASEAKSTLTAEILLRKRRQFVSLPNLLLPLASSHTCHCRSGSFYSTFMATETGAQRHGQAKHPRDIALPEIPGGLDFFMSDCSCSCTREKGEEKRELTEPDVFDSVLADEQTMSMSATVVPVPPHGNGRREDNDSNG